MKLIISWSSLALADTNSGQYDSYARMNIPPRFYFRLHFASGVTKGRHTILKEHYHATHFQFDCALISASAIQHPLGVCRPVFSIPDGSLECIRQRKLLCVG